MGHKTIGGLSPSEIEQIRKLKGDIQRDSVKKDITMSDAVMWAVNNELERRNE
jgi:hypothetical protein